MARELVYPEDYYGMQKRVRELEAELAKAKMQLENYIRLGERIRGIGLRMRTERDEQKARAEKAESLNKQLEDIANTADATMRKENTLRLRAEARVARLIARLEQWKDPYTGEEAGEEARERKVRR